MLLTTEQARKLQKHLDYYVPDESVIHNNLRTRMHDFVEDYIFLKRYYEETNGGKA